MRSMNAASAGKSMSPLAAKGVTVILNTPFRELALSSFMQRLGVSCLREHKWRAPAQNCILYWIENSIQYFRHRQKKPGRRCADYLDCKAKCGGLSHVA